MIRAPSSPLGVVHPQRYSKPFRRAAIAHQTGWPKLFSKRALWRSRRNQNFTWGESSTGSLEIQAAVVSIPSCIEPDRHGPLCLDVAWTRNACDGRHRETGTPLQLITPDLPDATDCEAEPKRSQDRETHYYCCGHRYDPELGCQLAAQEVTEPFGMLKSLATVRFSVAVCEWPKIRVRS